MQAKILPAYIIEKINKKFNTFTKVVTQNLSHPLILDQHSENQEQLRQVIGHHDQDMGGSELPHKAVICQHQVRG